MVASSTYYNTLKKAEKRVKEMRRSFDDPDLNRLVYTRYELWNGDKVEFYTSNQSQTQHAAAEGWVCTYRPIELEIVPLVIGRLA
jgi:hypothetical protein